MLVGMNDDTEIHPVHRRISVRDVDFLESRLQPTSGTSRDCARVTGQNPLICRDYASVLFVQMFATI